MNDAQLVCIAMQTCQLYADKMLQTPLTEYEMRCYEAACEGVRMFFKVHNLNIKISLKKYFEANPDLADEDYV